jgi:hypothetical protein
MRRLSGGGSESGNSFEVECESPQARQQVAYAASITPDPYLGGFIDVAPLTGPVMIDNPANGHAGSRLTFRLPQDTAGGRTVTWGTAYALTSSLPTVPSTTVTISLTTTALTGGEDSAHFPAAAGLAGMRIFKKVTTAAAPGTTANANGAAVTVTPDPGWAGILPVAMFMTTSRVDTETVTGTVTFTFSDNSTSQCTLSATTSTSTDTSANQLAIAYQDGLWVTEIGFSVMSSISSSTATATLSVSGLNLN